MNRLRIGLITQAPFPKGNVTTIRYTSYLKEFVKKGIYSLVLIYCPTRMAAHIKNAYGSHDGITYQYATRITWGKYNIFTKVWYLILGLIKSVKHIRYHKINTLIINGDHLFIVVVFYFILSKILDLGFFCERDEYPSLSVRNSKLKLLVYKFKYSLFDGVIVMTKELEAFYSSCSQKKSFTFLLPMTIDPLRFSDIVSNKCVKEKYKIDNDYISVVFGIHNRDGILESVKSYIEYKSKYNGIYDLVLIGPFENMPDSAKIKELIEENNLSNNIHICGLVDIDMVPSILVYSSCLLTTPNEYISGGFPTKIGEYMLSGVPIVATEAGELNCYIKNNQEILFAPPSNIPEIARLLSYVEHNKIRCKKIADNALFKATKVFYASNYISDLLSYISISRKHENTSN